MLRKIIFRKKLVVGGRAWRGEGLCGSPTRRLSANERAAWTGGSGRLGALVPVSRPRQTTLTVPGKCSVDYVPILVLFFSAVDLRNILKWWINIETIVCELVM